MRRLIENQIIRIDNHRAGGIIDWNDRTSCIHIHKECFRNNKKYIIKVPLNRDEEASFTNMHNPNKPIPHKIIEEIQETLNNPQIRDRFIKDVCGVLKSTNWNMSEENMLNIGKKISSAFGLSYFRSYKTIDDANNIISFTQVMVDGNMTKYQLTIDLLNQRLSIGQLKNNSRLYRHFVINLND